MTTRRWLVTAAVLAHLALGPGAAFPGDPAGPEDELVAKARGFLEALQKEDFERAAADFNETMMKASGPDKLAAFWKELPAKLGVLKRQTDARRDKLGPYEIVLVTCEFEKTVLDARVVFDKDGRIGGFQFVPSLPPAAYEPPFYADAARFEETEVEIGDPEWRLSGTLTRPKGPGPFPALVLVHGSGPNDRDETIGPNKPFKDLAWGLASRGIAVLRYDKRTKVHGARMVAEEAAGVPLTVKEETVDDALHAVTYLSKTSGVDPGRIFVLGHSLGGFLMPRIAQAAPPGGIAGFIVMAGLTRRLEDTMLDQYTYLYGLAGSLSEEDKASFERIKSDVARVKALKDSDRTLTDKLLNASAAYWLDLRDYDPAEAARAVVRPMLFLQGGRDYQVKTVDLENWKKALGGRDDVEFKLYPKLNHLFFEGQGLPTPNEYLQVHGSVAPYVIGDIESWISRK
jgi:uncharacterized protein